MNLGTLNGRVLLFGGPYSNLQATLAMKAEAEALHIPPSNIICNGDLAAYCASPLETVELIRDWGIAVVMGNCEESLARQSSDCGCGFEKGTSCALLSDHWFSYANRHISNRHRQWMEALPRAIRFTLNGLDFNMVHGAPSRINRFIFASTPSQVKLQELHDCDSDVVIAGHSGIPFGQKLGERYWLNTGAIGLPANDGTTDGWYLILTPIEDGVEAVWHRLAYDHQVAHQRMLETGLNNDYAEALLSGLWPSMDVLPRQERAQRSVPLTIHPLRIMNSTPQCGHLIYSGFKSRPK
jgi:predicted phosphodiesterase